MKPILESIQVGRSRQFNAEGESAKPWTSAIIKTNVKGSVYVTRTNIAGDEQADHKQHGGTDKAVLAYPACHYSSWNSEIEGVDFPAGGFGENLTVAGFDESCCCVGDTFRVGQCLLQVSQPRQPCWKLSKRWGIPNLVVLVQKTGRTGWYFRVLEEGEIEANMTIEIVERPNPDLTLSWANSVMYAKPRQRDDDLRLASCPDLSASWRNNLKKRTRRSESSSD
jgi:MOSC domain-containing protein YiiM